MPLIALFMRGQAVLADQLPHLLRRVSQRLGRELYAHRCHVEVHDHVIGVVADRWFECAPSTVCKANGYGIARIERLNPLRL